MSYNVTRQVEPIIGEVERKRRDALRRLVHKQDDGPMIRELTWLFHGADVRILTPASHVVLFTVVPRAPKRGRARPVRQHADLMRPTFAILRDSAAAALGLMQIVAVVTTSTDFANELASVWMLDVTAQGREFSPAHWAGWDAVEPVLPSFAARGAVVLSESL